MEARRNGMGSRSRRAGLLLAILVMHGLGLWLLARLQPRVSDRARAEPLVVQLIDLRDDVDPLLRVRAPVPPAVPATLPAVAADPVVAAAADAPDALARPAPAVPLAAASAAPVSSLRDAQGRLRVSRHLAAELDAAQAAADEAAARAARTFHVPRGDTWILREPRKVMVYEPTVFERAWMPEDMNPVEEACWRNRALAFVLVTLGSRDCADPGAPTPLPPPQMIVYGADDGDEILRKQDEWQRYERQ